MSWLLIKNNMPYRCFNKAADALKCYVETKGWNTWSAHYINENESIPVSLKQLTIIVSTLTEINSKVEIPDNMIDVIERTTVIAITKVTE